MSHVVSLSLAPRDVVKIIGCRVQQPVLMPLVVSLPNRLVPPQQRDVLRTGNWRQHRRSKDKSKGYTHAGNNQARAVWFRDACIQPKQRHRRTRIKTTTPPPPHCFAWFVLSRRRLSCALLLQRGDFASLSPVHTKCVLSLMCLLGLQQQPSRRRPLSLKYLACKQR